VSATLVKHYRDLAFMGFAEVVKNLPVILRNIKFCKKDIELFQPDALILIDYPGFNLRLARALRREPRSRKIIYYISPQVWAWNRGRIKQMARSLDLMLCIFPFEAELYNPAGLRTIFVGHPMVEQLHAQKIDLPRDPNLIALFPGSRRREVRKIFPIMLKTATELLRTKPDLRFVIAASSPELAGEMEEMLLSRNSFLSPPPGKESKVSGDRSGFKIKIGEAAQIMQRASVGIVASGSATQEAAYFRLPFVLVYKVSWLTYLAGRLVIKVDYLGMLNVIANRAIVPEFVQHEARPRSIAKAVLRLMDDPAARNAMVSAFDEIIASLGQGGASDRAALAILQELGDERR